MSDQDKEIHTLTERRCNVRYSREKMLSLKDRADLFVPLKQTWKTRVRTARKKSQSSEPDEPRYTSRDGLNVDEAEHSQLWHHANRYAWNPGNGNSNQFPQPHTNRQRNISGPHGDADNGCTQSNHNLSLRPNPDVRRGDWSRGCVGWRQRSFSGSEKSTSFSGNQSGHLSSRNRGSYFGQVSNDDFATKSSNRGRGRVNNRQQFHHRGYSGRILTAPVGNRPVSCALRSGSATFRNEAEDYFWREEDWLDSDVDVSNAHHSEKLQEPPGLTDSSVPRLPGGTEHLTEGVAGLQLHSEWNAITAPPGFDQAISPVDKGPSLESSSTHSQSSSTVVTSSAGVGRLNSNDAFWYYIDSSGLTQGPFGSRQMANWLALGYLPLTVEIRRDCDECFLSLMDHMSLAGRVPFWAGYNQAPITRMSIPTLVTSTGGSIGNSRWIGQVPPPGLSIPASLSSAPTDNQNVTGDIKATIAPSNLPNSGAGDKLPQSAAVHPTEIKEPPVANVSTISTGTSSAPTNIHSGSVLGSEAMLLLQQTHTLAAQAAEIEAKQQDLANQLAAFDSIKAKLFAIGVGSVHPVEEVAPASHSPTQEGVGNVQQVHGILSEPLVTNDEQPLTVPQQASLSESETEIIEDKANSLKPEIFPDQELNVGHDTPPQVEPGTKKSKRRNKKTKPTPEQEKLLAWEAAFEKRKTAALEQKLAEEAKQRQIEEEEAAAAAEQQTALMREQQRIENEHRKREAARVKAEQQMTALRLPQTARWAAGGLVVPSHEQSTDKNSLAAIQAAQALEEVEQKRLELLLAEQAAVALASEATVSAPKRPTAWASVVNADKKPASPAQKQAVPLRTAPTAFKLDSPTSKTTPAHQDRVRSLAANVSPTSSVGSKPTASVTKSTASPSAAASVWDIPVGDKPQSLSKSAKKGNKKNAKLSREAALHDAKEQLAHWCETQLSSMPLSGLDMPTLVDLLCDMEATDQVVEFLETSLGRSKRVSKFSKAFLEKRACVLNAVR